MEDFDSVEQQERYNATIGNLALLDKEKQVVENAHSKAASDLLINLKSEEKKKKDAIDIKLHQASLKVREEMLNDTIFGVKDVKEDLECIQKDIRVILRDLDQIKSELAFIRNK